MSLSSSLNTAIAGLDLSSRRAEVVSRNVANADRAGYARRSVTAGGPSLGSPGASHGIDRAVDARLQHLRREAQARAAHQETLFDFHARLDAAIGDPDTPGSLQDRLARLDAAFVGAAADPQSDVRLTEVVTAASDLVTLLNDLDDLVISAREGADADIAGDVARLNADLAEVARLNTQIKRFSLGGSETADLEDQRTVLVDRISEIVPVRSLPRDDGAVALVSHGGTILLDGRPGTFEFAPRRPITPAMTNPGQLSGLLFNGRPLATAGASSAIPGGRLAANFELRDEIAPDATALVDTVAADLIGRFEDPAVDPSRPAGSPGLFTEAGAALSAAPDPGLAGRLRLNGVVDPAAGGQAWRIRDGLGAAAPDPRAPGDLLLDLGGLIGAVRPAPGAPAGPSRTLVGLTADLKSGVSGNRLRAEDALNITRSEVAGLVDARDGGGVDIDTEMRRLIEIEQAYAANARVIQAVDTMLSRLTEL
ncbi:FlgK family flagellar hook-associated protein [Jannaschia marina]|uniref:FlgK family flagellar hook-associated protein n=1 Tax=Jannaschia marina TaxID=2741674 RepID=UPI0015CC49B8|nr:flagellar basal body rod C-terminal domain-containing protein [Jannaschia marina]